jgi:hypothetical protein
MAALPRGAYCHFSNSSSSSAVALLTWELLTSFSKIDIPGPMQSSPLSQKNLHGRGHRITVFLADHVGSCSFVVKRTIHHDPNLSSSLPGHRVIYGCLLDSDELVAPFSSSSAAIIILPAWPGLGLAWINYRKKSHPLLSLHGNCVCPLKRRKNGISACCAATFTIRQLVTQAKTLCPAPASQNSTMNGSARSVSSAKVNSRNSTVYQGFEA